jgi:hypothetical protein
MGKLFHGIGVLVLFVVTGCSPAPETPVPEHTLVFQQGTMGHSILVSEQIAKDDAALRRIAEFYLKTAPKRAVMVMVWTDPNLVPRGDVTKMSDAALAARVAVVTINKNTGFNAVERDKHAK